MHIQPSTNNGRHCRRHTKVDGDLAHHLLRLRRGKHVADDRARHHNACAGRQSLQCPKQHQLLHSLRQGAACRSQREHGDTPKHHRPAPETVSQRAMEQVHESKAEQVCRKRLLHLYRRGVQVRCHPGKRRKVGINGKRPQHSQQGKQRRQRPARSFPEKVCVWVHGVGWRRSFGCSG